MYPYAIFYKEAVDINTFFALPKLGPDGKIPFMTGLGKRQMERFNLSVPAVVTQKDSRRPGSEMSSVYKTRNVCAGGAFVVTDDPMQIDTEVDVNIRLAFFAGNPTHERHSNIRVSGRIIRIEPDGMAIQFDDKYQIIPVGS